MPAPAQIHRAGAGLGDGGGGGVLHLEHGGDTLEKRPGRKPVEIPDAAVVRQDLELRGGEEAGHEAIVLGIGIGAGASGLATCHAGAEGGRGAVVAVGDVGLGDVAEGLHESVGPHGLPDGVLDSVDGGEVVERLGGAFGLDEPVDRGDFAVREEHLPGVGVRREDVLRTIVLLVLACLLVAEDDVVRVVVDLATGDNGGLGAPLHDLAVKVDRRGVLSHESAFGDHAVECRAGLPVDGLGVGIRAGRQIDLGADDVEEGVWQALGHRGGLRRVHDVVRKRCYFVG